MVSTVKLGRGRFTYSVEENWEKLPPGFSWTDAAAVAVDSNDRVYVFNRGEHPMIVFDSEGNFLNSWGEGIFTRAHGLSLGPDDTLYCTDDGDHTVRQCTLDGEVLLTIGVPGKASIPYSGRPFNRCTHVATDPRTGDLYVSDGYGNARVHKYSADGERVLSWGEPGIDSGQFVMPHNIVIDGDERIYVADRECLRVQVFDTDGKFITMWNNIYRPDGMTIGPDGLLYIAELNTQGIEVPPPGVGHRISIWSLEGKQLARLGHPEVGEDAGRFIAPHGIAVDSNLDVYVGEVTYSVPEVGGRYHDPPREFKSLKKLRRLKA